MYEKLKGFTVSILILLLFIFFSINAPGFAMVSNMFNLLRQAAVLGIVSTGMAIVIISGGIDLSVGAVVSFTSCAVALMITHAGIPPIEACIFGIGISILAALLNSLLIQITGMPALLCTLATQQIYSGLTYVIIGGRPVTGLPDSMRQIGQGYLGILPIPVIIMATVFVVGELFMRRSYLGRYFYSVGCNAEATRLSGVSIKKINFLAYAICGLLVGLAAIIQMSRLFGGYSSAGSGLEMEAITAVVVGGVSFSGGSGRIRGVALGVLLMGVLSNGLSVMGVSYEAQLIFKGVVLILVVGIDYYQRNKKKHIRQARQKPGNGN